MSNELLCNEPAPDANESQSGYIQLSDLERNPVKKQRRWRIAGAGAMLVLSTLFPAVTYSQFEGVVESENLSTDETGVPATFTMTVWLKKGKAAIQTKYEGAIPGSKMIYRKDKNMMWILNTDEKTFVEVPQGPPEENPVSDEGTQFVKTGKTRNIIGYSCVQIVEKNDEQETEIWATTQLKDLAGAMKNELGGSDAEGGVTDELDRQGLFPLSSVTRINGTVVESQQVKKIERKSLPDTLFDLPAGYTKQTMDSMIEGMQKK
jgi:Domain of unknown function (DUF4412)